MATQQGPSTARSLAQQGLVAVSAVACGGAAAAAATVAVTGGGPGLVGLGAGCGIAFVMGNSCGKRRRLGALEDEVAVLRKQAATPEKERGAAGDPQMADRVAALEDRLAALVAEERPGAPQMADRLAAVEEGLGGCHALLQSQGEAHAESLGRAQAEVDGLAAGWAAQLNEVCSAARLRTPGLPTFDDQVPVIEVEEAGDQAEAEFLRLQSVALGQTEVEEPEAEALGAAGED